MPGFKPIQSAYPNFGLRKEALWLITEVHFEDRIPFYLEIATPRMRSIQFFQFEEERLIASHESSEAAKREHPFFRFGLQPTDHPSTVMVRIASDDAMTLPIYIWSRPTLEQTDILRHFGFGAFFGLMFSLSIYNFFIFLSIRDRAYIYYVIYILGFAVFLSVIYGYQSYFSALASMKHQGLMAPAFSLITSASALQFSHAFLLVRSTNLWLSRICMGTVALGLMMLPMLPFLDILHAVVAANIYPGITVFLVTANIVVSWKSGFKPARYFALAWSVLLVSVIYFILGNMGLVPGSFLSHYGSIFGASLEATLLSLALGYRISDLRERQEEAQKRLLEEQTRALKLQESYTESFRRFVPDQFLQYLGKESILDVRRGDSIQSEMTVLFSDLRNFTSFSEKAGEELVFHFLNLYLEQMQPVIQRNGGFIDKFIGDAIMALFPDPENAVKAATEMIEELRNMQHSQNLSSPERGSQKETYRPGEVQSVSSTTEPSSQQSTSQPSHAGNSQNEVSVELMESGCGLHHGPLMLGTVGASDRLETTVIGDTVNLASRLESLNKTLGTKVLISRETYNRLNPQSDMGKNARLIGSWNIKGKSSHQELYEVFASDPEPLRIYKRTNREELESIVSTMLHARGNAGLVRALKERVQGLLSAVPHGFRDGPAEYLKKQLASL